MLKVLMKQVILLIVLACNTYEFETSYSDSYMPSPCIPIYAPPVCEICHYSDLNSTSCTYYISDEGFTRLSSMIETMNRQQAEFEIKMWEFDLSHETDLRFSSPKLDVCLCDDGASFPPLESRLEVVLDPPFLTPSLVGPSSPSTLRDNTAFNMTLLDPPLPLAQSTEFEVGETFIVNASVDVDDTYYESYHTFTEVHDFDVTLEGRLYVDAEVIVTTSHDVVENISPDSVDTLHASPSCSLPSPSRP